MQDARLCHETPQNLGSLWSILQCASSGTGPTVAGCDPAAPSQADMQCSRRSCTLHGLITDELWGSTNKWKNAGVSKRSSDNLTPILGSDLWQFNGMLTAEMQGSAHNEQADGSNLCGLIHFVRIMPAGSVGIGTNYT